VLGFSQHSSATAAAAFAYLSSTKFAPAFSNCTGPLLLLQAPKDNVRHADVAEDSAAEADVA
jgi:hypothetical protein